jgi:hypothetical protein
MVGYVAVVAAGPEGAGLDRRPVGGCLATEVIGDGQAAVS